MNKKEIISITKFQLQKPKNWDKVVKFKTRKRNIFKTDHIRTYTGLYINVFEPTEDMICIEDIAHSLSHQCRFGGQLPNFYSVAQHSMMCAKMAKKEDKLDALMHDASEAYVLDMPRPIKYKLGNYKLVEIKLMSLIAKKFNFNYPMKKCLKKIDDKVLIWEYNNLFLNKSKNKLSHKQVEKNFLKMFYKLIK